MDCLFCKIAAKEIPSEVVYEDESVLAFLDIHPCTEGHALVIPKMHAENVLDLAEAEIGPLFSGVKTVTEKLFRALNPQGFTIGINHGKVSGQAVDHIHVHIIPRYAGDGGGSIHSVVDAPGGRDLRELAEKIKSA